MQTTVEICFACNTKAKRVNKTNETIMRKPAMTVVYLESLTWSAVQYRTTLNQHGLQSPADSPRT
jgi:hypothetical protein